VQKRWRWAVLYHCGDDGRFDVFIWRNVDGAFVDTVADNPVTPYDDYATYMAIDAFGPYGGELLDTTLAHEFNHALQASDDWWESAFIYEMSATFVEALVYPDQDDYYYTIEDFQNHPEWSLFHDDNYRTWYMYGAAMYLHFLRERHFPQDPSFIARIWNAKRSDPVTRRPDVLDALRSVLLAERGLELDASVIEFMQWRWFVAAFDDGAHFTGGGESWVRARSNLRATVVTTMNCGPVALEPRPEKNSVAAFALFSSISTNCGGEEVASALSSSGAVTDGPKA
jgi:hypothetical protein